jgi:hypothetical protein
LTRGEALDNSLEWLELLSAQKTRQRAAELIELMQIFNVAQGADKSAWSRLQKQLIDRMK